MNKSILIVICDFLVLSVLSLSSGIGNYQSPVPVGFVAEADISKLALEFKKTKAELAAAGKLLNESQKELLEAREKRLKTEKKLASASKKLSDTADEKNKTVAELEEYRSHLEETRLALKDKQARALAVAEKNMELQLKLRAYSETKHQLEQTREKLKNTAQQLSSAKSNVEDKDKILAEIQKKMDVATAELRQNKEIFDKAQSKLEELSYTKGKLEAVEKELAKTRSKLDSTVGELTSKKISLKEAETRLTNFKGILTSAVTELSQTKSDLKSTRHELGKTKSNLTSAKVILTKTAGKLTTAKEVLKHTEKRLESAEKQLKSDVFESYDKAIVKFERNIREKRWMGSFRADGTFYLPEVRIGEKRYIVTDFNTFAGIKDNWINHNRIFYLKYAISPISPDNIRKTITASAISLTEDHRICMLPLESVSFAEQPLLPLTFNKLKERGLKNLYLFKKKFCGKGSVELQGRCSINLDKADSYLYISNAEFKKDESKQALPGDFVLTKEGRFVGVIVRAEKSEKNKEAKCFVFPEAINIAGAMKIPLVRQRGAEFYTAFVEAVNRVNDTIREKAH